MVDVEGREDREILNFGAERKVFASWTPGRLPCALRGRGGGVSQGRRVASQDASIRWLLDDASRNVEEAYAPWRSAEAVIIEVENAGIKPSLIDLSKGTEQIIKVASGNLVPLGPLENGWWLGNMPAPASPRTSVRFRPDRCAAGKLCQHHPHLGSHDPDGVRPHRPSRFAGPARTECRCTAGSIDASRMYRNRHLRPRRADRHSEDRINTQIQYFVARGFNVLDPNYRGSTGVRPCLPGVHQGDVLGRPGARRHPLRH